MTEQLSDDRRQDFRDEVISPIAEELKKILQVGAPIAVGSYIQEPDVLGKAIHVKNVALARGYIHGIMWAAANIGDEMLDPVISSMMQEFNDPVFAEGIRDSPELHVSVLLQLSRLSSPAIVQILTLMIKAYAAGVVDTEAVIGEIVGRYEQFETAHMRSYYSGSFLGAVHGLDMLTEGIEDKFHEQLMDEYFNIMKS